MHMYLIGTVNMSSGEKARVNMDVGVVQEQQQEVLKLITGQLLKEQQAEARTKKQKEESEAAKARIAAGARTVAQSAGRDLHDDADTIPAQVSTCPIHDAQCYCKWAPSHCCKSMSQKNAQSSRRDLHDDADTIPAQVSSFPAHDAQHLCW